MNRQSVILSNRMEYGEGYRRIRFVGKEEAEKFTTLRSNLLNVAGEGISTCAGNSKMHTGQLSPGCRLCVEGKWSCLFINNLCNAHCFYCPSSQEDLSLPSTNNLVFKKPDDYVAYVSEFGFRGVSFSGGEPLLSFNRTIEYLRAVRKHSGSDIHLWLYTNGSLLTPEKVKVLAAEGLDEIRFDLSAYGYSFEKLRLAAGKIPVVTVEIPAVPEDINLLKQKTREMAEEGVDYLNLHQLRLTGYNFEKLTKRSYTFLHGAKVSVLESELAALELMKHVIQEGIQLPVNYCSFVYKNRYQALAGRKRYIPYMTELWEQAVDSGYLRSLSLPRGLPDVAASPGFRNRIIDAGDKNYIPDPSLLEELTPEHTVTLSYSKVTLQASLSYYYPYREMRLTSGMKIYLEKVPVFSQNFANQKRFSDFLLGKGSGKSLPGIAAGEFEKIPFGLAPYF